MILEKTCCFIGDEACSNENLELLQKKMQKEAIEAIRDGHTNFLVGIDCKLDILFAQFIMEQRTKNRDLFLEVVLQANKADKLLKISDEFFQGYNGFRFIQREENEDSRMNRDRYMIGFSNRAIIMYNGTAPSRGDFAMKYAHITEKEIREINSTQSVEQSD